MTELDQITGTPDPTVPDLTKTPDPLQDPTLVELERLQRRVAELEATSVEKDRLLLEAAREASDEPIRYAVYDTERERYVGPVYDNRPSKATVAALIKGDESTTDHVSKLVIREV